MTTNRTPDRTTTKHVKARKSSTTASPASDTAADTTDRNTSPNAAPQVPSGATTGVAPSRNGALPRLTVTPVSTPCFDVGTYAATLAYRMRAIVTFNGPSGTGKTTTAVAAAQDLPMRFVYVKLRHKAGTKEVATSIHNARDC